MIRRPRCTYLIEAKGQGLVKIGTTDSLDTRFRGLWGQSPVELVVLAAIPGHIASEWDFHNLLVEDRHHGEWFRLTPRVRDFIRWAIHRSAERWEDEHLSDDLPRFETFHRLHSRRFSQRLPMAPRTNWVALATPAPATGSGGGAS